MNYRSMVYQMTLMRLKCVVFSKNRSEKITKEFLALFFRMKLVTYQTQNTQNVSSVSLTNRVCSIQSMN